jgi:hypothetical protein
MTHNVTSPLSFAALRKVYSITSSACDYALADFPRWIINYRCPSSLVAAELTPVKADAGAA